MSDDRLHINRIKRAVGKIKTYLAGRDFADLKEDDEYFYVDPKVVWDTCKADLIDLEGQLDSLG